MRNVHVRAIITWANSEPCGIGELEYLSCIHLFFVAVLKVSGAGGAKCGNDLSNETCFVSH